MRLAVVGAFALGLLVTGILVYRFYRRVRIEFDGEVVTYVGVLNSRVVARVGEAGRAVTATVDMKGYCNRRWLLLDQKGRARLGLDLSNWDGHALDALARQLGFETEDDPLPRRPEDLCDAYAGAMPWALAHPVELTFVLIGVAMVALVTVKALV
jgi:hypothetical protein